MKRTATCYFYLLINYIIFDKNFNIESGKISNHKNSSLYEFSYFGKARSFGANLMRPVAIIENRKPGSIPTVRMGSCAREAGYQSIRNLAWYLFLPRLISSASAPQKLPHRTDGVGFSELVKHSSLFGLVAF